MINKWCWSHWIAESRMKPEPYLSFTIHKTQFQMDQGLQPNTLNEIEKKVGNTLELTGTGKEFLNRIHNIGIKSNN